MAEVPLLRIDERLIHGQVVAGFLRSLSCNRVIIIDDGVRNDKFMKKILEMAMPPSAKLTVYSCAEATESWRKDQFGPGRAIRVRLQDTTNRWVYLFPQQKAGVRPRLYER